MENIITITLAMEKATKNCIKFAEKTESEFVPEKLGQLYVQKAALAGIGYKGGDLTVKITLGNDDGIGFKFAKTTKNTVMFTEIVENEFVPEKIGNLYIPKNTLAELGYDGKTDVCVTLSAE